MSQSTFRLVRISTGIAGISLITLCMVAAPAAARQDPGPSVLAAALRDTCLTPHRVDSSRHGLARVGTQYVIGDNLTGNGVPAPSWIPELQMTGHGAPPAGQ